jgi:DNA-binding MarR family transcriptional regulator
VNPFSESHRRLAALAEIASDDRMTQRSLASALEVSLGLANALLQELESGRLVRVNAEAGSGAPRYAITRAGRSAMRRLARAFAAEAAALLKKSLGRRTKGKRRVSQRTMKRGAKCTRS